MVRNVIFFFFQSYLSFFWHKAYKTTQNRTSVGIVPPPPNLTVTRLEGWKHPIWFQECTLVNVILCSTGGKQLELSSLLKNQFIFSYVKLKQSDYRENFRALKFCTAVV